jgi:plastocyanin
MQPLHERFLTVIAAERTETRATSRRGFLSGGAKVAGGGALALAFAGAAGTGLHSSAVLARAQDFADDVDVLNYALTLEHLEFAFYRDGLNELGEDAFADVEGAEDLFARLEEIRDHEEAHVDALTQAITDLGGEPVAEAEYDFGYEDAAGFLEVAMALENTGVAAYAGAAPSIEDETVLAAALGIHSVEARHAAYLNERNETSPFPDAFDEALARDDVLDAAGGFIVADDAATPSTEGTGGAESGGEEVAVTIDGFRFDPKELEVAAGTTVTWTNMEIARHTVTADDGAFDSGSLKDGDRFSFTFDAAGTFTYFCAFHTSMKASVTVT